jgi:hypothetical protein
MPKYSACLSRRPKSDHHETGGCRPKTALGVPHRARWQCPKSAGRSDPNRTPPGLSNRYHRRRDRQRWEPRDSRERIIRPAETNDGEADSSHCSLSRHSELTRGITGVLRHILPKRARYGITIGTGYGRVKAAVRA